MDDADRDLLARLELALARRDPSLADEPLAALLDPDFAEHGSSGTRWSRADVVAMLDEAPNDLAMADVAVAELAEAIALVTYRSIDRSDGRPDALRSSLWVRRDGRWRMRFHQGTRASSPSRTG